MLNRVTEFINKHKLFFIGLFLYIIMCIVSQYFDPWETQSVVQTWSGMKYERPKTDTLKLYMPTLNLENRIFDKIPLSVLYFGISDVTEAFHNEVIIMFSLVTYACIAMIFFMNKYYEKNNSIKKYERWITAYLYDNVLFYIVSIVIRVVQMYCDFTELADNFFPWLDNTFGANTGTRILGIVVLFIIAFGVITLVMIPALPSLIYFWGYMLVLTVNLMIIRFIDMVCFEKIFGDTLFPREILTAVIAFIMIMAMNIIMEQIYEKIQKLSMKPVSLTVKGIKKGVSALNNKFKGR